MRIQLLFAALVVAVATTTDRPSYIGCVNSDECGPGRCCAIGADRFSVPVCREMRSVNETCRGRGHKPISAALGYPDGAYVELTNVYYLFCHCEEGLHCDKRSSTCQPAVEANRTRSN